MLAVALAGFTVLQGIAPHDEGLMLQAGSRIASGEWPYRDFWMNYPPGQPLVLALLQRAFGPSLLSWRILLLALDGTVSVLAWRLARRRAARASGPSVTSPPLPRCRTPWAAPSAPTGRRRRRRPR